MSKAVAIAMASALLLGAGSLAHAQSSTSSSPSTRSSSSSALSGSSSAPMNEAQVKQRLEADGYSDVSDVHKDKDGWTAKAQHNGKQVTVDVDSTGKIETR